jgi:hypothetical protein
MKAHEVPHSMSRSPSFSAAEIEFPAATMVRNHDIEARRICWTCPSQAKMSANINLSGRIALIRKGIHDGIQTQSCRYGRGN